MQYVQRDALNNVQFRSKMSKMNGSFWIRNYDSRPCALCQKIIFDGKRRPHLLKPVWLVDVVHTCLAIPASQLAATSRTEAWVTLYLKWAELSHSFPRSQLLSSAVGSCILTNLIQPNISLFSFFYDNNYCKSRERFFFSITVSKCGDWPSKVGKLVWFHCIGWGDFFTPIPRLRPMQSTAFGPGLRKCGIWHRSSWYSLGSTGVGGWSGRQGVRLVYVVYLTDRSQRVAVNGGHSSSHSSKRFHMGAVLVPFYLQSTPLGSKSRL